MIRLMKSFIILGLMAGLLVGCTQKTEDIYVPVGDLTVSPDFNWQAHRMVEVDLEVLTNANEPVSQIVFELFDKQPDKYSTPMAKGVTDSDGKYRTSLNLPSYLKSIWARGYMSSYEIPIVDGKAERVYGEYEEQDEEQGKGDYHAADGKAWSWLPGMSYNWYGVPFPHTNTSLEANFLQRVAQTLPENIAMGESHPEYLDPSTQQNLKLDENAQVWLTFVTEGAGYRNALGFIDYPNNNPPQNSSEVGDKTIILPNASLYNDGGGMNAGDTVYLGQFAAGTTLGWFLVADGWGGRYYNVSTNAPVYYSLPHLNPESNPAHKQHSVMVYDSEYERFMIGFEDLNRDSGSDDDFNDLVFFLTVNPIEAVDMTNVAAIAGSPDEDEDGIIDLYDDYPGDPDLAFNNYTYGPDSWGTLAFEDLWPDVGDYDFNDLVIDYNFNQITQAANRVKKVEMRFKVRAIGARKANGFVVELPFDSANMYEVNPSHPALFELENGTKAVARIFNSAFDLIPQTEGFINTQMDQPYTEPVEVSLSFKLLSPINIVNVSMAPPYNPFIYPDNDRTHEIHLPGYSPTALMDMTLFDTGDDASLTNDWYKSADNLPWAVNIPAYWGNPLEHVQITKAYLKFQYWTQSSGTSYQDWYLDLPGYLDQDFIFQTP